MSLFIQQFESRESFFHVVYLKNDVIRVFRYNYEGKNKLSDPEERTVKIHEHYTKGDSSTMCALFIEEMFDVSNCYALNGARLLSSKEYVQIFQDLFKGRSNNLKGHLKGFEYLEYQFTKSLLIENHFDIDFKSSKAGKFQLSISINQSQQKVEILMPSFDVIEFSFEDSIDDLAKMLIAKVDAYCCGEEVSYCE